MSQSRIKLLNDIQFNWVITKDEWNSNFKKLKSFYENNGHTHVSSIDPLLDAWCKRQRNSFKKKQLSQKKIELLESINFIWDFLEKQWNDTFYLLKEFSKKEGHANPSRKMNPSLSSWCKNQRKAYRENKLSKEKFLLLKNINFQWEFNK